MDPFTMMGATLDELEGLFGTELYSQDDAQSFKCAASASRSTTSRASASARPASLEPSYDGGMPRGVAVAAMLVWVGGCVSLFGVDQLTFDPSSTGGGLVAVGGGGGAPSSASSGGLGGGATNSSSGSGGQGGTAPLTTPLDCLDALQMGQSNGDGVYTVDPDGEAGAAPPLQVYCDMTTSGGGWTLVWAYTFTNYAQFTNSSNAVTPRPSWPLAVGDSVPVSMTIPLSPVDDNAMEFERWKDFGSEVLFVSNVTHWLRCSAGSGSIVDNNAGSMTCNVVMNVAAVCADVAPNQFLPSTANSCRPALQLGGNNYICWDGRTNNSWPTHDGCGSNLASQVQGLTDPQGALFVRRQMP